MLRPNDTYHRNDSGISESNERNQSETHRSSTQSEETEITHDTSLGVVPVVRQSMAAIATAAPHPAAMRPSQESVSRKRERLGNKRKKREESVSEYSTNPSDGIPRTAHTGTYDNKVIIASTLQCLSTYSANDNIYSYILYLLYN